VAPLEEALWCEVRWTGRKSHRSTSSNPTIVAIGGEMLPDLTCKVARSPVVPEPHASGRFPPEKPSKSVHWAVGVTSKTQSKCHVQCPPKRWQQSAVGGCDQMQHEVLLLAKHDCCGCWKSYVREKLDLHISSWFWKESLKQQQPTGRNVAFLSAHINLCCVDVGCVSISVPIL
jgi:hypothetical protein